MQRRYRLHRFRDIRRVRRTGRSYAHPLLVLLAARNTGGGGRLAVAVGRAVGNAVVRNTIRRRVRHAVRTLAARPPDGWDLLFIARKGAAAARYEQIAEAVGSLFRRAGVRNAPSGNGNRQG